MWKFLKPSGRKLLAAAIILFTAWMAETASLYIATSWMIRSQNFARVIEKIKEQPPSEAQKAFVELFSYAHEQMKWFWMIQTMEWVIRILLSYLGACLLVHLLTGGPADPAAVPETFVVRPGVLPDGDVCMHEGETSNYCTRCWTRLKPGIRA